MIFKHRFFAFLFLMLCICTLFEFGQHIRHNYISKCSEAAGDLLRLFSDIHFDGITYDDATNKVCLYEYVESCDSSSILDRRVKKSIVLESADFVKLQLFKNVKWCYDGLFFATSIGWDGEWSGIYINFSTLPKSLINYVDYQTKLGHYWLNCVPHHILSR